MWLIVDRVSENAVLGWCVPWKTQILNTGCNYMHIAFSPPSPYYLAHQFLYFLTLCCVFVLLAQDWGLSSESLQNIKCYAEFLFITPMTYCIHVLFPWQPSMTYNYILYNYNCQKLIWVQKHSSQQELSHSCIYYFIYVLWHSFICIYQPCFSAH